MNIIKINKNELNNSNNISVIKNNSFLVIFNILNYIISYYNFFIFLYSIEFSFINSFNFFKKIFINNNYFTFYNLKNNKKLYLFYYIMFKKQNSLMKKNFYFLNNLHPVFFKKNLKKKINSNNFFNDKFKLIKKFYFLKFFFKKNLTSTNITTFKIRKTFKKILLANRKLFKFLNFNVFKTSKKLSKRISINSKLKNINNLINLQFSLFNIILSSNLIKSYHDLIVLLRSNSIFLNRVVLKNTNKSLMQGDLIELNISTRFYNYMSFFKNTSIKHINKIKNKIWFKLKFKNKYKLDYNENTLLTKTFKNNLLFKSNIPNYLEVDHYSFSIVVLLKNFNFNNLNINIKKILVVYLFKLYNWK